MITPILMLLLMTGPWILVRIFSVVTNRERNDRRTAAMGLTLLFLFTGVGHFIKTENMAEMLPPWVPQRVLLVYVTGIFEMMLALGFLVQKYLRTTGWIAVVMLMMFLPVNIYAAFHQIPMGGHAWGPIYLFIRIPLQLIILFWIYLFSIREEISRGTEN